MRLKVEFEDRAVMRRFMGLEQKVRRKILAKAVRAGAKPVLKQARQNTPVDTGNLAGSLRLVAGKPKGSGARFRVNLYVDVSEQSMNSPPPAKGRRKPRAIFYGAMVEFGHNTVTGGRFDKRRAAKGQSAGPGWAIGEVEGARMITRAHEQRGEESVRIISRMLLEGTMGAAKGPATGGKATGGKGGRGGGGGGGGASAGGASAPARRSGGPMRDAQGRFIKRGDF